ncbi:hypothetical protein FOZ62_020993 [Perkinsus olseni]|uniref:Uncharacterized protein n=1 Tax=Perkinsus olseni TaxID=32597 RepID=A0A7J6R7P3_PEROL|nr:hypothetical protein FOZ62_020993 [Perkinsus olseni]
MTILSVEGEEGVRGSGQMTVEEIAKVCQARELFKSPHLNTKLLLHGRGFTGMCDLSQYYNVKFLSLDFNMISEIKGLEYLSQLTSLHLQGNQLTAISGLGHNVNLRILNLSDSHIKDIGDGLKHLRNLSNLNLSKNELTVLRKVADDLSNCPLTSLDLGSNRFGEFECLEEFTEQLKGLRCLYLHRNPGIRGVKNLRKKLIGMLPELNYLDDRPVSVYERQGGSLDRRQFIKDNEMRDAEWEARQKQITKRREMALQRIAREELARGLNQPSDGSERTTGEGLAPSERDDRGMTVAASGKAWDTFNAGSGAVVGESRGRTIHVPSTGRQAREVPWNDEQLWQSAEVNREALMQDANLQRGSRASILANPFVHEPPSPTSRTTTAPQASELGDMD